MGLQKFDKPLCDDIIRRIQGGNFFETACAANGVNSSTFRRWMQKGKSKDPKFRDYRAFRNRVRKALGQCEATHVENIMNAAKKNWCASAWFLERKFPQRWAVKNAKATETGGTIAEIVKEIASQNESFQRDS